MRHTAEAPVRNERPAVVVEEHVARLQVAVNDAKTMQVHKPLATHRKHTQLRHRPSHIPNTARDQKPYPQYAMQHQARFRHTSLGCAAFKPCLHVSTAAPRHLDVPVAPRGGAVVPPT